MFKTHHTKLIKMFCFSSESAQNDTAKEEEQQKSEETDESLTNRKRKLRPKPEPPTPEPAQVPVPPVQYEKPPNPYELFLSIRSQVSMTAEGLGHKLALFVFSL